MTTGLTAVRFRPQLEEQTVPPMLDWDGRSSAVPQRKPINAFAPPPPTDHVLQWHLALDAEREPGMTPVQVIKAVDEQYPGLRQNMIAQHRERQAAQAAARRSGRPSVKPKTTTAAAPSSGRDFITVWKAEVARWMSKGMSRSAAIRHVDRERPGLRQKMLEQHNRSR